MTTTTERLRQAGVKIDQARDVVRGDRGASPVLVAVVEEFAGKAEKAASADDQRGIARPQGGACDAGAFEQTILAGVPVAGTGAALAIAADRNPSTSGRCETGAASGRARTPGGHGSA